MKTKYYYKNLVTLIFIHSPMVHGCCQKLAGLNLNRCKPCSPFVYWQNWPLGALCMRAISQMKRRLATPHVACSWQARALYQVGSFARNCEANLGFNGWYCTVKGGVHLVEKRLRKQNKENRVAISSEAGCVCVELCGYCFTSMLSFCQVPAIVVGGGFS